MLLAGVPLNGRYPFNSYDNRHAGLSQRKLLWLFEQDGDVQPTVIGDPIDGVTGPDGPKGSVKQDTAGQSSTMGAVVVMSVALLLARQGAEFSPIVDVIVTFAAPEPSVRAHPGLGASPMTDG